MTRSVIKFCLLVTAGLLGGSAAVHAALTRPAGSPIPLAPGTTPQTAAVGDVNRDGVLDVVVTGYSSDRVAVLLGRAGGGFAAPRYFAAGPNPVGVALGDFNDDDRLDIAVTNDQADGSVRVLFGAGDGTFGGGRTLDAGANPRGIVAADLNEDGFLDLAVANAGDGSVTVLLGNGTGLTEAGGSPEPTGGALPQLLTVADFNRDRNLDLAVANSGDNSVSVLLGNGRGGFSLAPGSPFYAGPAPVGIDAGDLDRDGFADIVVTNDTAPGQVRVFFGDGTGGFPQWDSFPVGDNPTWVEIADLDGDRIQDLLVANHGSDTVSFLEGRGNGDFLPAVQTPAGRGPLALALADLDDDGDLDVVVTNHLGDAVTILLQGVSAPADTRAPVTTATLSPQPNAAGWNRTPVRVTLTARDEQGGSGVREITYSATGAQPIGERTVSGNTASVVIEEEGVTRLTFFATDRAGNEEEPQTLTVRIDRTAPVVTASATPTTLSPPNGKPRTVTVTGRVTDALSGVALSSGRYTVDDEYDEAEPSGTFAINPDGTFRFTVRLPARRRGNDRNGRTFTIRVSAQDLAGNTGTDTVVVTVPHDSGDDDDDDDDRNDDKKDKKKKKKQKRARGRR